MPESLVSRLMKPFLVSLMLFSLIHSFGLPAAAEEAADLSNSLAEGETTAHAKPGNSVITDAPIENGDIKKHLKNLPIQIEKPGASIRVHPQSISITVLGPPPEPKEGDLLGKAAFAYIETEGLATGVYVRPARIILPNGYVLIDAVPELFVLEITAAEDTTP